MKKNRLLFNVNIWNEKENRPQCLDVKKCCKQNKFQLFRHSAVDDHQIKLVINLANYLKIVTRKEKSKRKKIEKYKKQGKKKKRKW